MAKKVRLEFTYEDGLVGSLKSIFETTIKNIFPQPEITIVTRMTEHDISEGTTKMIEATEIIHEKIGNNTIVTCRLHNDE